MNSIAPVVLAFLLVPVAVYVSLPALSDIWAVAASLFQPGPGQLPEPESSPRLLFLVPAHNEMLLIERCVHSLLAQAYPREALSVVVIADNCSDETSTLARAAGAHVLERSTTSDHGKSHAIRWALAELPDAFDAMVIVDADSVVAPDFGRMLALTPGLRTVAVQAYDGLNNEFENALTRLAGVLTRARYHVALRIKSAARLNCPLTGNGISLGREVLARFGWAPKTVTEGWELYASLTLAGVDCLYCPKARVEAQETRELGQSRSQRARWTTGRMQVLRLYGREIFGSRDITSLQKLDLLAELSSLGPIVRGGIALVGLAACILAKPLGYRLLVLLFSSGAVQPALYAALAMPGHPQPLRTLSAFAYLPVYAVWRLGVAVQALIQGRSKVWVRTGRRVDGS